MPNGLIGVIVPVYKVEKYIAECIESILAQTYTNFRLILVDDGTPDEAGKICDEYAKKDQRITVVHQDNAGVTRARARGVKEADNCEFITFVDSDDTITPNALHQLIKAIPDDTDIVISHVAGYKYPNSISIEREEYLHHLISGHTLSCAPWGKLFRKTLFTEFVFDIPRKIVYGEDLLMNVRLSFNTNKKIIILDSKVYNYNININGCDKTFRTSPDYECLFHKHLVRSIPHFDLQTFYEDTIKRRIAIMRNVVSYKYIPEKKWLGSNFHKKFISDIKAFKYNIHPLELITITYSNFLIRILPVTILKLLFLKKRFLMLF